EQQDMPDHQVARIRPHQRTETARIIEVVGNRLLQEHLPASLQQRLRDSNVFRRRAGDDPRLSIRFLERLLETGPSGNSGQFGGELVETCLPTGDQPHQPGFREPGDGERVQPAESPQPDDADLYRFHNYTMRLMNLEFDE